MDEGLRELERRCETAGDAGLWAALARARLRSGLRPAVALAAVRAGIRLAPADAELARIRDEALAAFWREPTYVPLLERHGASGRHVVFSHDGELVAVAGPGVLVLRLEPHELVGGGYSGESCHVLAFVGSDLLLERAPGLVRFTPSTGREGARFESKRFKHAGPIVGLVTAPDGQRGILYGQDGTTIRFGIDTKALHPTDRAALPVWTRVHVLAGLSRANDAVILRRRTSERLVAFSGERFERETPFPGEPHWLEVDAFSPDRRAAVSVHPSPELHCLDKPDAVIPIAAVRSSCRAAAFSPCGSRLALIRDQPPALVVLEAC